MEDTSLYDELIALRDALREQSRSNGRPSRVCSDEACAEMARLRPLKVSDLTIIPGLGQAFRENFADDFLEVLNRHAVRDGTLTENVAMDRTVEFALQELEKKLVNISRNNRLLFMPRVRNPREVFDLSLLSHVTDVLAPLFDRSARVTIATKDTRTADGRKADYHQRLSQLQRNINRIIREKGQNDLYVGYPFVEGSLPGERFDIKAPLALFPVEMVRDSEKVDLRFDDSRDIVFNNTLVLGYFKLCRINRPLPDNVLADADRDSFIQSVKEFYEAVGLTIKGDGGELEEFVSYRNDEFPSYSPGFLRLRRNAVIGRFPTYSNSIQKDFIHILDGRMVSPLLDELLLPHEDGDTEQPAPQLSERELTYISDLNTAQEEVVARMRVGDRLVIQGPPGTGKSQTITNLVAEQAGRGRTVLLVSEKKAALDVVYSRLGHLSDYAMLIDDVGSKDLFYRQLEAMISPQYSDETLSETSDSVSGDIQGMFDRLDGMSDAIGQPCPFGLDPCSMYTSYTRPDPSEQSQLEMYNAYSECFPKSLLECDHDHLSQYRDRFSRPSAVTDMFDFLELRKQHDWMTDLRPNMNDYDIENARNELLALRKEIDSWRTSGFFSKMLNRGKMKARVEEVMSKYWTYYSCHDPAATYFELDEYIRGLEHYDEFSTLNNIYESLGDHGKMYLEMLHRIVSEDIASPNVANRELYRFNILQQIQKFESENKELLRSIASFEEMQRELESRVEDKEDCSRSEIRQRLAGYFTAVTGSKRFGDMRKVLEMKRRWTVSKFVGRFDFELFKGIKIWLLTPEVVSEIVPMQTGLFDLVIFDEASQMFVERGIPSVMRAKKVVIAGDHKQLRPSKLGAGRIGMDEDDAEAEGGLTLYEDSDSLLDVARSRYPSVMLRYHYRSRFEELIAFSNHAFYDGKLNVAPNLESDTEPPIHVHKIDDGRWSDRCNRPEAEKVVELLETILKERRENETVGVITFNSSQMDLIESLLEEKCSSDPVFADVYRSEVRRTENGEDVGLFVKNIENVQGDERDIIIFSIGYAVGDNGKLVRNFGWLNQAGGENRLNVAISRARKGIHIVTSFVPADLYVDDMRNEGPRLLKRYLQYCFAVSSGARAEADSILRSLGSSEQDNVLASDVLADKVYMAMVRRGFEVDRHVGIGGYTLDMAVRRNGRYVLGIECDSALYSSGMSPRERDLHRRRYLESMGWNVYRIWSPMWWKDPEAVMDRISSIIDSERA